MRNLRLRHVLQQVPRAAKAGTLTHVQAPARHMGGLSLSSTRDKRATAGVNARRPTETMELRRAAEVQKCADKVRGAVNGEAGGEVMTTTANARRRFLLRAVSGLVPPSRSKYTSRSGWKSALICLGNMHKGGVAPGSAAYNVALKACVEAGKFDRAAALLEDMEGSGATPDADIVREIEASGGAGGGAGLANDDSLTCDAVSSESTAATASNGDSRRSMSSLSGGGGSILGGSGRGSAAGMHTAAVGADIDWPSRRPAREPNSNSDDSSSSRNNREDSEELLASSFDPFSLGPINSTTTTSSGGGCGGSVAGMHTVAAGADGGWPSRRSSSDGSSGSGGGGGRCRSLGHVAWGGGRERWHQKQQHEEGNVGSHTGVVAGGTVGQGQGEGEGAWLSVRTAPFAGSWGDD